MTEPVRIAMWSGPRNISTAMMRSWEARGDADVCDEPLYAHYLWATKAPHPGADEVIAQGQTDWRRVVAELTETSPNGRPIYYQKQMTHHMLPQVGREWMARVKNAFLVRSPKDVVRSLLKVVPNAGLADTGFPQQLELFQWAQEATGGVPPVVDAQDVLNAPGPLLKTLCEALGVPYTDKMLSWAKGPRATDGVWAKHWYANVEKTTGFEPLR